MPPRASEVYLQALPVGSVRPRARVQGFIYFARLPSAVGRVTISISSGRAGGPDRHELRFPFAVQGDGASY